MLREETRKQDTKIDSKVKVEVLSQTGAILAKLQTVSKIEEELMDTKNMIKELKSTQAKRQNEEEVWRKEMEGAVVKNSELQLGGLNNHIDMCTQNSVKI